MPKTGKMAGITDQKLIGDIAATVDKFKTLIAKVDDVLTGADGSAAAILKPLKSKTVQVKTQSFGVSNVKKVLTFLGAQIKSAYGMDTDGDGKTSTAEYLAYAFSLIPTIPGILPALQSSKDEFGDLTSDEVTELVDHVLRTDFLPDDRERAEHYVKALFFALNTNRLFIRFSVDFFAGKDVKFNPLEGLL